MDFDLPDLDFDDPISGLLFLIVLALLLPALIVAAVFSLEIALLLLLIPLLMTGQLVGLLPWTLNITESDGTKRNMQVRGTRAMLRARRALLVEP